jgi:hypothetical protein
MAKSKNRLNPWLVHYINAFEFIVTNGDFSEKICSTYPANLNADPNRVASAVLSSLKVGQESRKQGLKISIPQLEIPIVDKRDEKDTKGNNLQKKHRATFLIGGNMELYGSEVKSYSFSVCITFSTSDSQNPSFLPRGSSNRSYNDDSCCLTKCGGSKRVVRRIHFDYQPEEHPERPLHFQIGGKFPGDSSYSAIHYCLEHFLEKPRIPCKPEDFLCLLDFMIREFNTPLEIWRKDPQWGKLVKRSRELLQEIKTN